jgi:hypothetical protein
MKLPLQTRRNDQTQEGAIFSVDKNLIQNSFSQKHQQRCSKQGLTETWAKAADCNTQKSSIPRNKRTLH